MNPIKCLDFETTGVDAKTCKVVEVALLDEDEAWTCLVNPGCEIPAEASAVHHIINDDVEAHPPWEDVKNVLRRKCKSEPLTILVAHNAEYEKGVLGDFCPVLWICTYKVALRVFPNAPSHKNEVLRYHLKLGNNRGREGVQRPHSAEHDTRVTWLLFKELLKHVSIEQMIEWTEQPAKLPRIPLGKFYNKPWSDADSGYLTWLTNQADMREDVKYCAREELKRRRGG